MSTQGVNQIPLPADVQKTLENAQNRVSLLEAESTRLARLNKVQEAQLNSQLENEARVKQSILALNDELAALEAKKNDALAAADAASKEESVATSALNEAKKALAIEQEKAEAMRAELDALKQDLAATKAALIELSALNDKTIAKLKPFVEAVHTLYNQL